MKHLVQKMFTLCIAISMVLGFFPTQARASISINPTELFFSEYVEGSSNNKALEIYNGTATAINLSGVYDIQFFFNGAIIAGQTIALTGSVAAGDVYVLAISTASATILAQADQTSSVSFYNGDDAIVLRKSGIVIDSIGQIGFDPGTEWGTGLVSTADNTLRRLSSVCDGDTNASDVFDPSIQWEGYATDTFSGLGSHTVSCTPPVDNPPTVSTTYPLNGATAVPPAANLSVTFSEAVTLADPWFSISCTSSGSHTAVVSGGPTSFSIDPAVNFTDGETCTFTVSASAVSDQDGTADNMVSDYVVSFSVVDPCLQPFTPIYDLQGSGFTTPMPGTRTTMGVVVGDYELPTGSGQIRGYFLQDETGDADPATSDGIFVYNAGRDNVSVGDLVRVTGDVTEYQDQTQISAPEGGTVVCGTGTITPTDVTFPLTAVTDLEKYESMLVRLPQTMYVTEHYQLGRFGQVTLSYDSRLQQPTNVVEPGDPAIALQEANNLRKIILDDANNLQNVDPIVFARGGLPLSASNTLRGGDTATGIVGVLNYTWGGNSASPNAFRIRPVNALNGYVNFEVGNPRPTETPEVDGTIKVVGMNMLNYFNTFDGLPDTVDNCTLGVGGGATDCRGADTQAEFDRQWPKTVAAILKMDPDVIGFNEIENDGYGADSAIAVLVDQLNAASAAGTYAFIDADAGTGQVNALGTDAIKVGMIYKPAVVTPTGDTAALNTPEFVTGGDSADRNRPSLAQAFEVNDTGAVFIVDINHLKSKGSACDDPDTLDGQGNCNLVRVNAATELVNWLAADPTGTGDPDIILLGDYNSYSKEDPIDAIKAGGYANLVDDLIGADAYSYVFDGQWGYLDYAFGSADILSQVKGIAEYHIDSDEPSVLDYNTDYKTANLISSLYSPDEFRISDHDPVIVGLVPNAAPSVDAAGPYAGDEGTTILLTASGSDPNNDELTYAWDLDNNGSYETAGKSVNFELPDGPAEVTVGVQATDPGGLSDTDTATVTVNNAAPVVAVPTVSIEPSLEGTGVVLSATFKDPIGVDDEPFTCTVDYGDGSGIQDGVVTGTLCEGAGHVYTTSGAYTVTVNVTDADGATGTNTRIHNVKAVAPVAKWPNISTTMKNPKFIWSANPGEIKYQINLYRGDGTLVKTMVIDAPTCDEINCWYTPNPKLNLVNGEYKWKVRSYLAAWSAFSGLKTFSKYDPPAPLTPTGSTTDNNPKFTWVKIPGATKYTLVVNLGTGELVREITLTSPTCGTTTCSYKFVDPLNLKTQTMYKWKVRAFNGYFGPYSAYLFFQR